MISYMISEDNDIDYDIIGFEMSMIYRSMISYDSMISITYDIICL